MAAENTDTLQRAFCLPSEACNILMGKNPKRLREQAPVYIQSWAFQVTENFLLAFLVGEAHRSKMNARDKNN